MTGSRIRLLSLADREFRREAGAPKPQKAKRAFKGMNVSLGKFDARWDRARGSAARMTGVLLREDADALHGRVCADERSLKDYDAAAEWLQGEARYLRKVASLQETAASRLTAVLDRCREMRLKEVPAATG